VDVNAQEEFTDGALRRDCAEASWDDEMLRCYRCDQPLAEDRAVWLELNARTGQWSHSAVVPPSDLQGRFPFGAACARRQLGARSDPPSHRA
jgi:hypothetical protein